MAKTKTPKDGDILLSQHGTMMEFTTTCSWDENLGQIVSLGETGYTMKDMRVLSNFKNLGQSDAVLAAFHSAHGIHLRLNRLSNV